MLRYGHKIALFCTTRSGYVLGTTSAMAPLGVAEDSVQEPIRNFEQAVFTIVSGDGEMTEGSMVRNRGKEVKFGQVIRLVHHKTNKVASFCSKTNSIIDPAHQRVILETPGVERTDQWDKWRVMPRYKVRGEGERVCDGDHVVFQVSTGDHFFLHVCKRKDESVDGCYEVNSGPAPEGFAIRIYDSDLLPRAPSAVAGLPGALSGAGIASISSGTGLGGRTELRGGDTIILFHKEEMSYVVADSPESLKAVLHPVRHDRRRGRVDSKFSMFVVEFQNWYRGGVVLSGRQTIFRLKDLRSGLYLTARTEGQLALASSGDGKGQTPHGQANHTDRLGQTMGPGGGGTTDGPGSPSHTDNRLAFILQPRADDDGSLFCFHKVGEDSGQTILTDRSNVYIECPYLTATGSWVVSGERLSDRKARRNVTTAAKAIAGYPRVLRTAATLSHGDGIELHRLPDRVNQKLNTIMALLPPVTSLIASLDKGAPDYTKVVQTQENLAQLKAMCLVAPSETQDENDVGVVGRKSGRGKRSRSADPNSTAHGGRRGRSNGSRRAQSSGALSRRKSVMAGPSSTAAAKVLDETSQSQLHDQGVSILCLSLARQLLQSPHVDMSLLQTTEPLLTDADLGGATLGAPPAQLAGLGGTTETSGRVTPANAFDAADTGAESNGSQVKHSDVFELVQQAFSLTQVIVRNAPSHAAALDDHLEFLVECIPAVPAAVECLVECLAHNAELLDNQDTKITDYFIDLFAENPRYAGALRVLGLVVACDGVGMKRQQTAAVYRLFGAQALSKQNEGRNASVTANAMLSGVEDERAAAAGFGGRGPNAGGSPNVDSVLGGGSAPRARHDETSVFLPGISVTDSQDGAAQSNAADHFIRISIVMGQVQIAVPSIYLEETQRVGSSAGSVSGIGAGSSMSATTVGFPGSLGPAAPTAGGGGGSNGAPLASSVSCAFVPGGTSGFATAPPVAQLGGVTQVSLPRLIELLAQNTLPRLPIFIDFLTYQIQFFAALCTGRNTAAVTACLGVVSLEALIACIVSDGVPSRLRATLLNFFTRAIVESEAANDFRDVCRSLHYVVNHPSLLELESEVPTTIQPVKDFAVEHLTEIAAEVSVSNLSSDYLALTDAGLQVCHALFCRGLFGLDEYTTLLQMLVQIISPHGDVYSFESDSDDGEFDDDDAAELGGVSGGAATLLSTAKSLLSLQFITNVPGSSSEVLPTSSAKKRSEASKKFKKTADAGRGRSSTADQGKSKSSDPKGKRPGGRSSSPPAAQSRDREPRGRSPSSGVRGMLSQDTTDQVIRIQRRVLDLLDTMATFIVSRDAVGTVHGFCHGRRVGRLPQLFDLDPSSNFSETAAALHVQKETRTPCDRKHRADNMAAVLKALMHLGAQRHFPLRAQSIRLFTRLTDYAGELLSAVKEVQLLTTRSSAQYYREAKAYAAELIAQRNTLLNPNAAIQSLRDLDTLLASPMGGSMQEKVGMLRHLQVHTSLLQILHGIEAPPPPDLVEFILHAVGTLQVLVQEEAIALSVAKSMDSVTHLTCHNVDILSLLRATLVPKPRLASTIAPATVKEIVSCLGHPHSSVEALVLLQDIIKAKDTMGRYATQLQDHIWRALASTFAAQNVIRFKNRWTGRRGHDYRRRMLGNANDCFSDTGTLRIHLEATRLIHLLTLKNNLTKHEEIRQEVFGATAVNDLLEIAARREYGVYYRAPFVALLHALVVDDKDTRRALFARRAFVELLRAFVADIRALRAHLGDKQAIEQVQHDSANAAATAAAAAPFVVGGQSRGLPLPASDGTGSIVGADPETGLISLNEPTLVARPKTDVEAATLAERDSLVAHAELVLKAAIPCVAGLCENFQEELANSRMPDTAAQNAHKAMNQAVDELCELVRFSYVSNSSDDLPVMYRSSADRLKLRETLTVANENQIRGSDLWASDLELVIDAVPCPEEETSPTETDADPRSKSRDRRGAKGSGGNSESGFFSSSEEPKSKKRVTMADDSFSGINGDTNGGSGSPKNREKASAVVAVSRSGGSSAASRAPSSDSSSTFSSSTGNGRRKERKLFSASFLNSLGVVTGHSEEDSDDASPEGSDSESIFGSDVALSYLRLKKSKSKRRSGYAASSNGAGGFDEMPDELSVAQRWHQYIEKYIQSTPPLKKDNTFASAAGLILRSGLLGTHFLAASTAVLTELSEEVQHSMLQLLRQAMTLKEGHGQDDSFLAVPEEIGELQTYMEAMKHQQLSLDMPLAERQNIISSWGTPFPIGTGGRATAVLPNVVQIICETGTHTNILPATECGIALTSGGNKPMQQSLMDFFTGRPDEEIFFFMRNRFAMLRDAIRVSHRTGAASEQYARDLHVGVALLRLCQLFCEGHNADMQNYLRQQPDNQISVNVLESLVLLLDSLVDVVEAALLPALNQVLATIAETVQGPCRGNQDALVTIGVGDSLARLLSFTPESIRGASEEGIRSLHEQAVTVLLSLLEGRNDPPFMTPLLRSLSLTTLVEAMDRSYVQFQEAEQHNVSRMVLGRKRAADEFEDELNVGVQIFIFFKMCIDIQGPSTDATGLSQEFTDKQGVTLRQALRRSRAYKALNSKVATIEISRGGGVESVYFRIPTISRENLYESTKDHLIKKVARDSDTVRLLDFFERANKLILELEYYDTLGQTPLMTLVHQYSTWLDKGSLVLAVAINVFLLATLKAPEDVYSGRQSDIEEMVTNVMGYVQALLQLILFGNFFFGPMRVYLESKWLGWQDQQNGTAVNISRRNLSIEPPAVDHQRIKRVPYWYFLPRSGLWLLKYNVFYLRVLFLVAAILGIFDSPVWFSIQLLQIVQVTPQLFNVVLAITQNGLTLILTFTLQLIVVYIFAIIAFYNYAEYLRDVSENFSCHSLWQCTLIMANNGLRMGGGIAEVLPDPNYHTSTGFSRFFYDLAFFMILIVIFLNIVFGIIVDTFAELRERRNFVDQDQASKCFICGVADNEFDRASPGGFRHHVTHEHNMWHYLYFLHYVQLKQRDQLNGAEHAVRVLCEQNEPTFFPIGRAVVLDRHAAEVAAAAAANSDGNDDDAPRNPIPPGAGAGYSMQDQQASQQSPTHRHHGTMVGGGGGGGGGGGSAFAPPRSPRGAASAGNVVSGGGSGGGLTPRSGAGPGGFMSGLGSPGLSQQTSSAFGGRSGSFLVGGGAGPAGLASPLRGGQPTSPGQDPQVTALQEQVQQLSQKLTTVVGLLEGKSHAKE